MVDDDRPRVVPTLNVPLGELARTPRSATPAQRYANAAAIEAAIEEQQAARRLLNEQGLTAEVYIETNKRLEALSHLPEIRATARADILNRLQVAIFNQQTTLLIAETTHIEAAMKRDRVRADATLASEHARQSITHEVTKTEAFLDLQAITEQQQADRRAALAEQQRCAWKRELDALSPLGVARLDTLKAKRAGLELLRQSEAAHGRDVTKIVGSLEEIDRLIIEETINANP